jgi:hypothetical protein
VSPSQRGVCGRGDFRAMPQTSPTKIAYGDDGQGNVYRDSLHLPIDFLDELLSLFETAWSALGCSQEVVLRKQ